MGEGVGEGDGDHVHVAAQPVVRHLQPHRPLAPPRPRPAPRAPRALRSAAALAFGRSSTAHLALPPATRAALRAFLVGAAGVKALEARADALRQRLESQGLVARRGRGCGELFWEKRRARKHRVLTPHPLSRPAPAPAPRRSVPCRGVARVWARARAWARGKS